MVQSTGMLPALILAGVLLSAAPASASSIVVAGPVSASPSIIMRGTPVAEVVEARSAVNEAARDDGVSVFHIGTSIIAYGADAIPRSSEQVAAIEEPRQPRTFNADAFPMVMRGGIVGDAFARPAPQPVVASDAPMEAQPPASGETAPAGAGSSEPAAPSAAAPTLEAR